MIQAVGNRPVIAHDAKALGDVPQNFVFDTAVAGYLLDPARRGYPLDELAEERGIAADAGDELATYAVLIHELAQRQRPQIHERGLTDLMNDIELPLVHVLRETEKAGIKLDTKQLETVATRINADVVQLERDIWELADEEFVIGSPQQLGTILFDKLKLSRKRRGKTGYSTDARVLQAIRDEHEIIPKIERYRELSKLAQTPTSPGSTPTAPARAHIAEDAEVALKRLADDLDGAGGRDRRRARARRPSWRPPPRPPRPPAPPPTPRSRRWPPSSPPTRPTAAPPPPGSRRPRSALARTRRALDQAKGEREALGAAVNPQAAAGQGRAGGRRGRAGRRPRRARRRRGRAHQGAAEAETAAREAARKLDEQLGRLTAEARALAGLVAQAKRGGFAPALDAVSPDRGYEAALAAALGDDLDAALDRAAPSYWGGREAPGPGLARGRDAARPAGQGAGRRWPRAWPSSPWSTAPTATALQAGLPPGARLVSKEGDLWRWDGFTARADAPKPAAVRLEQKTRLAEVEAEIEKLEPRAKAAREALARRRRPRCAPPRRPCAPPAASRRPLEQRAAQARAALERFDREAARKEAQRRLARRPDRPLRGRVRRARGRRWPPSRPRPPAKASAGDLAERLAAARAAAGPAREAAAEARAALDVEVRERDGRARRLETLTRDRDDWTRRAKAAAKRLDALADGPRQGRTPSCAKAKAAPETLETRRAALLDELAVAEARRAKSSDALAAAEHERAEADRGLRAAEAAASEAREVRASLAAHAEAAASG